MQGVIAKGKLHHELSVFVISVNSAVHWKLATQVFFVLLKKHLDPSTFVLRETYLCVGDCHA